MKKICIALLALALLAGWALAEGDAPRQSLSEEGLLLREEYLDGQGRL